MSENVWIWLCVSVCDGIYDDVAHVKVHPRYRKPNTYLLYSMHTHMTIEVTVDSKEGSEHLLLLLYPYQ